MQLLKHGGFERLIDMAYQITESKRVATGKNLCSIYIDDLSDLSNIPEVISNSLAVGSAAYTAAFDIYTLSGIGWVNDEGRTVSI